MLLSFSAGNFLSFKDPFKLSFEPDSLKEREDYLHIPYMYDMNERLLKSIGIYGHNSHGKSNFIKSYDFFRKFILTSADQNVNAITDFQNFQLNTVSAIGPSTFETEFYIKETKYKYGFKLTTSKIFEEWLYYSESKVRPNYLFLRVEQDIKTSKQWHKESGKTLDRAIHYTKPQQLLLSNLIQSGDMPARIISISDWLRGNILLLDISDEKHLKQALYLLSTETYRPLINRLIDDGDLGFKSIISKIDSLANNKLSLSQETLNVWFRNEIRDFTLHASHNVYDESDKLVDTTYFEVLKRESAGTIKFLVLTCFLVHAIKQGQLIIIDEIDSKFHSDLLKLIMEFYHDAKVNVVGSQMIFTTHNTVLLNDILRRDQIIFVEKDFMGISTIKKAHSSKMPLRIDSSIEKEYRKGKIGGVSKKLNKKNNNQTTLDF